MIFSERSGCDYESATDDLGRSGVLREARSSVWHQLDLLSTMQAAIGAAVEASGLDSGAIYLLQENVLYLGATTPPLPPSFPDELRYAHALDHPHVMKAVDTESPVVINDLRDEVLSLQEQEVMELRGLRSILYVPLYSTSRPLGVFMVASVGQPRTIATRDVTASQTLAYSISQALMDARLFDNLLRDSSTTGSLIRQRLTSIADEASQFAHGGERGRVEQLQHRIRQRLALLQIRDEMLREEIDDARAARSTSLSVLESTLANHELLLADAIDESAAFALDPDEWDVVENGLAPALNHLISRVCSAVASGAVSVDSDARLADLDTTLLLYRTARELLTVVYDPGCHSTPAVTVSADRPGWLVLEVSQLNQPIGSSTAATRREMLARDAVAARLRRIGGEFAVTHEKSGTIASASVPHFPAS